MALVPEYKYSDGPGWLDTTDGKYTIGYNTNLIFQFKHIIEFDMTGITPSQPESDPYIPFSISFDNGVVLKFCVWMESGGINYVGKFKAFLNDVEFTAAQYNASALNTGAAGEFNDPLTIAASGTWYAAVQDHRGPWKMALMTMYPSNAVENVTPADSLAFCLFAPTMRTIDNVSVYNDLDKITDGAYTTFDDISHVFYEGQSERIDPARQIWQLFNITTFGTWMKTAGTGMDDPIGGSNKDRDPEDDNSHPGGGGGSYDPTSDPIDFPDLPSGGALTSGMLKGFVVGSSDLIQFQNKLWDMSIFDIATQFQKLVNQPLDCIISLHALPVLPSTGSPNHIMLGSFDTGVSASVINNQYVVVDCGTLQVPEYYGSALDYSPFTKCEIFLPFIGFRNLVIDDVEKMTITLKYYVDVLTGSCVAFVKCGQSVLYSFTGSCIQHIPVMASSSDLLHNTVSAIGPLAVGIATGNPASAAAGSIMGAVNTATSKNHVSRTGDLAGAAGILGEFVPYMIFHRPKQSLAKNYNKFKGYPSNITYTLSTLKGYTEVEHIHLTGISGATDTELKEIEDILKKGVII